MTPGADDTAVVRTLVDVHRTAQGALWVDVQALGPEQDLGRVPLSELPVLLEALVAAAGPRARPLTRGSDWSADAARPP